MSATQADPTPLQQASRPERRLIIHAGMHKTGSTTIQHYLNGDVLVDAHYIKGPKANHSLFFRSMFGDKPDDHRMYRLQGKDRDDVLQLGADQRAQLETALDECDIGTCVFSGEYVSKATRTELERSQAFFSNWFLEIEVYAYMRSPVKFAVSMFQQHLKFGALPTVENILPDYRKRVQNLDAVFQRQNVHLRAFDALDQSIPDVLPDFLQWAKLEVKGDPPKRRNTSLSAEATAILFAIRGRLTGGLDTSEQVRLWKKIVSRVAGFGGQKYGFSLEFFGQSRELVLEDHAWIESRLEQRFPDPMSPGTAPIEFSQLEDIGLLGQKSFKARTGKALRRSDGDNAQFLKRAIRLLGNSSA